MKKDYYEILGLNRDVSAQDIKKKYRSLALKYHPDRVPQDQKKEAEEKFKEISEAYGVLSDAEKRKMYDQHGHAGIDRNFTSEDIFRGADFSGFGDLGDIFSQFFGGGGGGGGFDFFGGGSSDGARQARPRKGRDIQYEMEVTLDEAFAGATKKITVPRYEHCVDCNGSGAKSKDTIKTCSTCGGSGQVVMSSGFFRMAQTCSACGGQGRVVTEHCPKCVGRGMVKVTRHIEVTVPAGVDNDSRMRVRGEGEVGAGGAGDLYLYILLKKHPIFRRVNVDIEMDLGISYILAALGGEMAVPTLSGEVKMKIPAGTQSGKVFRLKGRGMPILRGNAFGDQYVRVMIEVPKRLSAVEREHLEELARLAGVSVEQGKESAMERVKKIFK